MQPQLQLSSSDTHKLTQNAQACLEQAVEIPGAPLYHMGNIAIFDLKSSFDLMQATIDYLTCKAKAKLIFTKAEKTFLIELYETFWWGGYAKGMSEAGRLADHYVNGGGETVRMDSKPYEQSVVVKDTMQAMKAYVKELDNNQKYFQMLKTNDIAFRKSAHFKSLMLINGSRNILTQGYVKSTGVIHSEKNNQKLQKADNRFLLTANTTKANQQYHTWWSVDNRYDFEPFGSKKEDKFTDLDFGNGKVLLLLDGLSEYMDSGLGIAKPYGYSARWSEQWK